MVGMIDTTKNRASISTIDGPPGVSKATDTNRPSTTDSMPKMPENRAICSGVSDKGRAAAAGMIRKAMVSKTPTILMAREEYFRTMNLDDPHGSLSWSGNSLTMLPYGWGFEVDPGEQSTITY